MKLHFGKCYVKITLFHWCLSTILLLLIKEMFYVQWKHWQVWVKMLEHQAGLLLGHIYFKERVLDEKLKMMCFFKTYPETNF